MIGSTRIVVAHVSAFYPVPTDIRRTCIEFVGGKTLSIDADVCAFEASLLDAMKP